MIKKYVPKQEEQTTSEIGNFFGFNHSALGKGILLQGSNDNYYQLSKNDAYQIDTAFFYKSIEQFMENHDEFDYYFADTLAELFRWMGEE